jgi:hypothetical protein
MLNTQEINRRGYHSYDSIPELPAELNFDPVREKVTRNGVIVPDSFWVVNPNTDTVMTTSKRQHNPVNFTHMWDAFREGVAASGVDTSQLEVKFNVAHGARAFSADIIFKRYDYERIVGEATQMKMRILDSHDMTLKRDIRCMLLRLACTNGMVSVGENLSVKQKHTTLSDPEKLGAVVAEYPERLENEAYLYKHMMHTRVTKDQAIAYAEANVATYRTNVGVKVNKKTVEEFARIWNEYSSLGDTGYRLYNVMTHIGTHVTGRADTDVARKQIRIEDKVAQLVQEPEFRILSGLAA